MIYATAVQSDGKLVVTTNRGRLAFCFLKKCEHLWFSKCQILCHLLFTRCNPSRAVAEKAKRIRRPNAFNILHQLEFLERTGLGRDMTVKTLEVGWGRVGCKPINRWNNLLTKFVKPWTCCISSMKLEKTQFIFRCLRPMRQWLPSHQPIPWVTKSPGQPSICSATSQPWRKMAWPSWYGYPTKFDHCSNIRVDTYLYDSIWLQNLQIGYSKSLPNKAPLPTSQGSTRSRSSSIMKPWRTTCWILVIARRQDSCCHGRSSWQTPVKS